MKLTYGLVPIVAGLDKFTDILVDWQKYLPAAVVNMLPFSPTAFMYIVGVIEIIAGVVVLMRPRIGAYIVCAWLVCIAINLIIGGYYDIAVRDLAMAIGAYSLGRLSAATDDSSRHGI